MLFKASSIIILSKYVLPNVVRARLPSPIRIKSWIVLREVIGKYHTTSDISTGHKLNSNQSKSGGVTPSGDGDIIFVTGKIPPPKEPETDAQFDKSGDV
jgi:hypothetical protein